MQNETETEFISLADADKLLGVFSRHLKTCLNNLTNKEKAVYLKINDGALQISKNKLCNLLNEGKLDPANFEKTFSEDEIIKRRLRDKPAQLER